MQAKHLLLSALVVASCLGGLARGASADSMQVFEIDEADNGFGLPIHASATFEITGTTLEITLENLLENPTSVNQAITGLYFSITTGESSGTLDSSSGQEIEVASGGTYALGSTVAVGWDLLDNTVDPLLGTTGLNLQMLGSGVAPSHAILGGPGGATYSNAKGSIAGNLPHNSFIYEEATFVLSIEGLTDASRIGGATFQFNTSAGTYATPVPEPASLTLLAAGLGAAGLARRRRRRRAV